MVSIQSKNAANRTVSKIKSAGTAKSEKIAMRIDKNYPGATQKLHRKELVEGALSNLLYPEESNGSYPAPIGTSNVYVASASVAGDIISMPNGNGSNVSFDSMIIQQNDFDDPVLYSSGSAYEFEANGNGTNGSTLHVTNVGFQWGTLYNDRKKEYLCSHYNNFQESHIWDFVTTGLNSVVTCTDRSANPVAGMFTTQIFSGAGAYIGGTACNAAGVAATTIAAAGTYTLQVYYQSLAGEESRLNSIVVSTIGGAAEKSPVSLFSLIPLSFSNSSFINNRSDRLRLNCQSLLLTSVIPKLYEGGTIQIGKIISSEPPPSTYASYLYTLKKKYLSNLAEGGYGMLFPTADEWKLRSQQSSYNKNSLASASVVNMYLIHYNNPAGTALTSLDLQLKIDGWVDYTTLDTTISVTPGVVFVDEWLTAVSALEAVYIFSDNPSHNQIKAVIKKAVDFIRGGSPVAQALRAAGSASVKILPPLLMAAGLL